MKINSKYRLNAGSVWVEFYGVASSYTQKAHINVTQAIEEIDEAIHQLENQQRIDKNSQVAREYITSLKSQQRLLEKINDDLNDIDTSLLDEREKIQSTPMPEALVNHFNKLSRNRYRR